MVLGCLRSDLASRAEPTASPLQASLEQLRGLPPALVITDEADVLRDEGEAYGRKLRVAGVDATAVRYEGVFHDFMMLNALAETNAARGAITLATDTLRAVLADNDLSLPPARSLPTVEHSWTSRSGDHRPVTYTGGDNAPPLSSVWCRAQRPVATPVTSVHPAEGHCCIWATTQTGVLHQSP